jgi:hypothetical protein
MKLFWSHLNFNPFSDVIKGSTWTSGSSEGEGCDVERKFAWCPAGTLLDTRLWTALPDGNATSQRCLQLTLDAANATLERANCTDEKKPFVCQVGSF